MSKIVKIMANIITLLKYKISNNNYKVKQSFISLKNAKRIANSPSYYPNSKRKNCFIRYCENIFWALKYHEANFFYNLYGLDINGNKTFKSNYIDYYSFKVQRNAMNTSKSEINSLRNKKIFEEKMRHAGIPTPKVIESVIINNSEDAENLYNKYKNSDVFVKRIDGECANGVFHINNTSYKVIIPNGEYIIQNRIIQNSSVASLYRNAINTVRICTYIFDGKVNVLTSGLRIGTSASGSVDNWAAGGIFVGINDNGELCKYGFYKPMYGLKTTIQPDSKITFAGFKVPEYDKVEKIVKDAHLLFSGVKTIGWDVAISVDGPMIIEGNDNWELSLMQVGSTDGLKNEWKQCVEKIKNSRSK